MLGYWAMKGVSLLLCICPRCLRELFATALGELSWRVVPAWRRYMAVENIKDCLGVEQATAERLAKESVTRFGRMVVEVLRFPLVNKNNFRELVHVEGEENLAEAYAQGKGVIMCTAHFGNWEFLGGTMALLGYPILSITRKQNNGGMDKFINEYREMLGQKVTYNHGGNSMLAINRILRDKNLLGVLYDQDTEATGERLDFFGKSSVIPTGAGILSRMHGAPILPTFMHNNPDGTLTAKIYKPLYAPKTKDRAADVHVALEQLVRIAEQEIKADPAMWFWVHDRWKDGRERYRRFQEGVKN